MPARLVLAAALAIASHAALAQTPIVPPAVTVQRLAPQLVAFAGSEANFQALVAGLTGATQVQLFTVLPTGFTQNVTFTPTAAVSPAQAAQILEAARQQLIGLGIGNPTAEQIAFALMGGIVPTALGGTPVAGQLNAQAAATPPSPAAQMQGQNAGAGATASTTPAPATPGVTNRVNVQTTPGAAVTPSTTVTAPRINTSDSLVAPGTTSRSASPVTSASPASGTSASPITAGAPLAPGVGSTPPSAERIPPGTPPARN